MKVTVLGLELGSASGWDDLDDSSLMFYDFVPNELSRTRLGLRDSDLFIDLESGAIQMDFIDGGVETIAFPWDSILGATA